MPAAEPRGIPLARVWLYDAGQGDPVVTDHGFVWYDVLQQSAQFGRITTAADAPELEVLEGIGLVCRPVLLPTDTRTTHWTKSGGTWEELKPAWSAPRTYRMVQLDTAPDFVWSLAGLHDLPADPSFAISLDMAESPPDWDATGFPQYVRLEWGEAGGDYAWALYCDRTGGWLLQRLAGEWVPVLEIPGAVRAFDGAGEWVVYVRHLRGQILLSTDYGRSYARYADPLGATLAAPAGKVRLTGQGGSAAFGLHALKYESGQYTSPPRPTLTSRILPSVSLNGSGLAPAGTSYVLADLGDHPNGSARWRATLNPGSTVVTYGTFYRTPELYSVLYQIAKTAHVPTLGFTEPWAGKVVAVDIDKPQELDQRAAQIRVRINAATDSLPVLSKRQKVRIWLGHTLAAGGEEWLNVFTGYLRSAEPQWQEYPTGELILAVDGAAVHLRETTWTEQEQKSLGGQTANAALDAVLNSEGMGTSYRLWHNAGALTVLPAGTAEQPFEMIRPDEPKWTTAQRIASYAGLELLELDDGRFLTLPRDYGAALVSHVYRTDPDTLLTELPRRAAVSLDWSETATVVIVSGQDAAGQDVAVWVRDAAAETVPTNPRFSPWRVLRRREAGQGVTAGILTGQALGLAQESFVLPIDFSVAGAVRLNQARRDRIAVEGLLGIGLPDGAELITLTLQHRYRADPSFGDCETTVTARRVW